MEPETGPGPQELIFEHAQGYFVSKALVGIWRLGLWDELEAGELDVMQVAKRDGYDAELLDSTLSYLVTRGYLERRGPQRYVLSALGKDSKPFFGYLPHLVGAYEPIFASLEGVLKGEVRYGQEVQRIERELAVAVGSLWEKVFARLASLFTELEFSKVLDMGSGSGQVLSQICSLRDDIHGVGVDWNVDAGAEAYDRVRAEGLEGRVELVQGDAANLRDLPGEVVAGVDLITAMFVMHEILRQRGQAGVVECLRTVRDLLPDQGRFVMVEVSRLEGEGPSATLFTPEYQLVHDFSNQRLASHADWEEMLDAAGFEIEQIVPAGICQAFCVVAVPSSGPHTGAPDSAG